MRAFMLLIGFALLSALPASPLSAAALGETCDGIAAIQCDEGLWCEHPAGQCKVADGAGICAKEPGAVCTADYLPVCGCDGKTYGNDCERKRAKAQLDHVGECAK
jgi:hypothetical protein